MIVLGLWWFSIRFYEWYYSFYKDEFGTPTDCDFFKASFLDGVSTWDLLVFIGDFVGFYLEFFY